MQTQAAATDRRGRARRRSVLPDDELLAGAAAQRRLAALALRASPASVSATKRAASASISARRGRPGRARQRDGGIALPFERRRIARWTSSSSGTLAAQNFRRLCRFESTRSCSSYVATMPRRSRAVATRWTRAASFVLLPVHRRNPSEQRRVPLRVSRLMPVAEPSTSSSPSATRPQRRAALRTPAGLGRALPPLRARRAARREASRVSAQPRTARTVAACGRGLPTRRSTQPVSAGRLRRRLRLRACFTAPRERRRRRALDGRHGRHPARSAEAGGSRPPAARLRVDRAAGAARAAPGQDGCGGCIGGARVARGAIVAYSRARGASGSATGSARAARRSCSFRSAST